ncbi:MAG TPA: 30S ribosomal protein S7 [Candidatus Paceibacterota bacterium]|nr:30S ribosomal protein S7 [Candidatus Paceibacterota bacterium]
MRRPVKHRIQIEPDLIHQSVLVSKFINNIMMDGKKSIASRIVYQALDRVATETKKPALEALELAINNAGPNVELKSRRIGGANYQVPVEVRPERRTALAMRWIIDAARAVKGKPMADRLAEELLNTINNTGGAIKKKADVQRMAEANKAFAHFAW